MQFHVIKWTAFHLAELVNTCCYIVQLIHKFCSQLTTVKVCIQSTSKLTKVAKLQENCAQSQKLCNCGKKISNLHCSRSQFSCRSNRC